MQATLSARGYHLGAWTPYGREAPIRRVPIDRPGDTSAGRRTTGLIVPGVIDEATRLDRLGRATQAGRWMASTVRADVEYASGRFAHLDSEPHVKAL